MPSTTHKILKEIKNTQCVRRKIKNKKKFYFFRFLIKKKLKLNRLGFKRNKLEKGNHLISSEIAQKLI